MMVLLVGVFSSYADANCIGTFTAHDCVNECLNGTMANDHFLDGKRYYGAGFSLLNDARADEGFVFVIFGSIYPWDFGGLLQPRQMRFGC